VHQSEPISKQSMTLNLDVFF